MEIIAIRSDSINLLSVKVIVKKITVYLCVI